MFWLIIIRFCDSVRNRFEIGCLYQSAFVEERILIRLGAKRFLLLTQIHPRLTMRLIQILLRCRDRLYPIENSRRCSGRGWQFWVSEGKGRGLKDLTFIGSNGNDLLDSVRRSLIVCRLCWRSFFFKFKNLRSEKKRIRIEN